MDSAAQALVPPPPANSSEIHSALCPCFFFSNSVIPSLCLPNPL